MAIQPVALNTSH